MASAEPAGAVPVELVYAEGPHRVMRLQLALPVGTTVAEALLASGWATLLGAEQFAGLRAGVWGRPCEPGTVLRPQDRVELYRPLQVDPKEARRQRYRRDGLKKQRR